MRYFRLTRVVEILLALYMLSFLMVFHQDYGVEKFYLGNTVTYAEFGFRLLDPTVLPREGIKVEHKVISSLPDAFFHIGGSGYRLDISKLEGVPVWINLQIYH